MLGIALSIGCAFTWSFSVILLKIAGTSLNPIILNLGKNTLGLLLLIPTALLLEGMMPQVDSETFWLLSLSGFFGIGIADAFVLKALEKLPASRIAILECLYSPFVIVLSILFLQETLSLSHALGGALIILALILVTPKEDSRHQSSLLGVIFMTAGLLTMAGGIVIVKPLFDKVSLFWLITIRMAAGVAGSVLMLKIVKNRRENIRKLFQTDHKSIVLGAFILSSYISISLWIAGYKYLPASLAAVLNQTSTIFTVVLASLFLKEPFEQKKIVAAILASLGVVVISVY